LTNPVTGTGTSGQVAYWSSGSAITGESNLFWDSTNDRLGIATATPTEKLDVTGVIRGLMPSDPLSGTVTAKILSFSPSPYGLVFRGYASGVHSIQTQREANDSQLFGLSLQPLGGNVLIGTTTDAGFKLDVNGTGRFGQTLNLNGTNPNFDLQNSGTSRFRLELDGSNFTYLSTLGANNMILRTNSTARLTLDGSTGAATFSSSVQGLFYKSTNGTIDTVLSYSSTPAGVVGTTSNHALEFYTNSSPKMLLTTSGNLGLGVTPSAWQSGTKALQINGGSMYAANTYTFVGSNIVYTDAGDKYINTGFATVYGQLSGEHRWYTAPSGTAGNTISLTQAMTLGSNSGLSIGTPSAAPSQGLLVEGVYVGRRNSIYQNSSSTNILNVGRDDDMYGGSNLDGGVFVYGNNKFHISTNLNRRLTVDGGGNVGIGTTSPTELLQISKTQSATTRLQITNAQTGGSTTIRSSVRTTANDRIGEMVAVNGDNIYIGSASNHNTNIMANGGAVLTATPAGNVGIGTTSPQAPLHVIAASSTDNALIQEWSYTSGTTDQYSLMLKQTVTSGVVRYNFSMVNNNVAFDNVLVLDRGNVGIGTASPYTGAITGRRVVDINGTTDSLLAFSTGGTAKSYFFQSGSNFIMTNLAAAGGFISFENNGSERMRITAAGRVLIGTPPPAESTFQLDVNGTGRFSVGLTTNGTRPIVLNASSGNVNIQGGTGGWAVQYGFSGNAGTNRGGFGALGGTNDLSYWFIGKAYNDNALSLDFSTGAATFSSSVTATKATLNTPSDGLGIILNGRSSDNSTSIRFNSNAGAVNNFISSSPSNLTIASQGNTPISFVPNNAGVGTAALTITGGGNVLIGTTTTPTAVSGVSFPLTVSSSAATRIRIDSTNASPNSGVGLYANGVQKFSFAMYGTDSDFTIYNDALLAPALTVKGTNSNVLIGTTDDNGNKLRVNGVGFFDQGIRTGNPYGSTTNNVLIGRFLTETASVNGSIRVQIGTRYYNIAAQDLGEVPS
jgi:hypothetical protein